MWYHKFFEKFFDLRWMSDRLNDCLDFVMDPFSDSMLYKIVKYTGILVTAVVLDVFIFSQDTPISSIILFDVFFLLFFISPIPMVVLSCCTLVVLVSLYFILWVIFGVPIIMFAVIFLILETVVNMPSNCKWRIKCFYQDFKEYKKQRIVKINSMKTWKENHPGLVFCRHCNGKGLVSSERIIKEAVYKYSESSTRCSGCFFAEYCSDGHCTTSDEWIQVSSAEIEIIEEKCEYCNGIGGIKKHKNSPNFA
jgi:hypothetical protein